MGALDFMNERMRVFVDRLVHVAQQSAAIDVRSYETGPLEPLRIELLPVVREVGRQGLEVLDDLVAQFEPADSGTGGEDGTRVADLAFLGRLELGRRLANLSALVGEEDRWSILTVCEDCLRKTRKAASAVEGELSRRLGEPPRIRFTGGRSLAREIRRHYGKLRREVERAAADPALTLDQRIRTGTTGIARLVGREVYRQLRVSDRAQLRRLQARLLSWMQAGADRDPEEGRQLWHDLKTTVALLGEINMRSELRAADRELAQQALEELTPAPSTQPPPPGLLARLQGLRGRDTSLDDLLDTPTASAADWHRELERVRRELR